MQTGPDSDIEALLKARNEIDAQLRQHKGFLTVMFTDLLGSTSFFEERGDVAGLAWLEQHNRVLMPLIQKHGGRVVKTIGDAIMAYFPTPPEGLAAAVAMQRELDHLNESLPKADRMYVRIGLHCGHGYLRGGDVFGDVVNVAARIVKRCQPAQILISEALYEAAQREAGVAFRAVGSVPLHGKAEKESLWEAVWCEPERYEALQSRLHRPEEKEVKVAATPPPKRVVSRPRILVFVLSSAVALMLGLALYWRSSGQAPSQNGVPNGMVEIPGGAFVMGRTGGPAEESPEHSVSVGVFYIDRTEVTNADYARFVQATGHPPPATWSVSQPPAGAENLPVTGVRWGDADAFCRWAGKRLPTEAEWEMAARGTDGRLYPWGSSFEPRRANSLEEGQERAIRVGALPAGASPFAVLDMAGNVWEWVADDYAPYSGSSAAPLAGGSRIKVIRGGSFGSDANSITTTTRSFEVADHQSESIGFRCAVSQ